MRLSAHISLPIYPRVVIQFRRSPFEVLSGSKKKKKKGSREDDEEDEDDEDEKDRGGNAQPPLRTMLTMFCAL